MDDEGENRGKSEPPDDDDLIAAADELAEQRTSPSLAASAATLALPVSSTEALSTIPCMATSVPSVMISEGTSANGQDAR